MNPPWNPLFLLAVLVLVGYASAPTALADSSTAKNKPAAATRVRALSPAEVKLAIRSLLAQPSGQISKDPSCQADLASDKGMTVAAALAETLVRAATDGRRITVRAECFVRRDYPLKPGEEYCRMAWIPTNAPQPDPGYGLLFLMNWQSLKVDPATIECY